MTNREFYLAVSTADVADEIKTHALDALAAMDARNAARKEKPTKAQIEARERAEAVLAYLVENDGVFTRDVIAEALGITVGQVTAAVKMAKDGKVATAHEITISKVKRDKSTVNGYSIED